MDSGDMSQQIPNKNFTIDDLLKGKSFDEKVLPEIITEAGIYINKEKKRWELWFIDSDSDDKKDHIPQMMGFTNFDLGIEFKDAWKREFFQRWAGIPLIQDGWNC